METQAQYIEASKSDNVAMAQNAVVDSFNEVNGLIRDLFKAVGTRPLAELVPLVNQISMQTSSAVYTLGSAAFLEQTEMAQIAHDAQVIAERKAKRERAAKKNNKAAEVPVAKSIKKNGKKAKNA